MNFVESDFLKQMLGREDSLFSRDILDSTDSIKQNLSNRRVLVIGAAGSIGSAVVDELAGYDLATLVCVDISENNLVEVVRRLRSRPTLNVGELETFCLDTTSIEFQCFLEHQKSFDVVFNLSAMKHVRSERDPYTLMRMITTNSVATAAVFENLKASVESYFAVSTDKATRPQNLMGASKRLMEILLSSSDWREKVSFARFANVAFSDGSLLRGFQNRIQMCQPLSAPRDIRRYFISAKEAADICLIASARVRDAKILTPTLSLPTSQNFYDIGVMYLEAMGKVPVKCESEEEARLFPITEPTQQLWPIHCFDTQTTGEKVVEEFFTDEDLVDLTVFQELAVVSQPRQSECSVLNLSDVSEMLADLKKNRKWTKADLVALMKKLVPELSHEELNMNLDQKM